MKSVHNIYMSGITANTVCNMNDHPLSPAPQSYAGYFVRSKKLRCDSISSIKHQPIHHRRACMRLRFRVYQDYQRVSQRALLRDLWKSCQYQNAHLRYVKCEAVAEGWR